MSNEFVQFNFPCSECIVRAACKNKPENNAITHLYDSFNHRCLAVPKLPKDLSYIKGLIECWANLGTTIINNMHKTENPANCSEINNNIPMQYVFLMGQITYLLQWMTNSISWDDGVLHEFDRVEIRNKLKAMTI